MRKESKIRLSQTMIVKNEEDNIEAALTWGKDIIYEQIVVDTGSTDRTVEKAKTLGAKVEHFDWIDDFAAAKNFALERCKGDWIAILDADEYFSEEDAGKILGIIEKADIEGYCAIETGLVSIDGKGGILDRSTHIRIIKNSTRLRYKRRIHEILDFSSDQKVFDATQDLNIIHTGYIEEIINSKNKKERNLKLLLKELEVNGDDPEILGYIADDYASSDHNKAIEFYRKAIEKLPVKVDRKDARTATTFTKLIILLSLKNSTSEIKDICRIAEEKMPENSNFIYYTGLYFYNNKDFETAEIYYKKTFEKFEIQNGRYSELWVNKLSLAYAQYGHILLESGDIKGAVSIEGSVLKSNKKEYLALTILLKAFSSSKVPDQMVMDYLKKIYDFSQSLDKLLVYKASDESGFNGIKEYIYTLLDDKEKSVISKSV